MNKFITKLFGKDEKKGCCNIQIKEIQAKETESPKKGVTHCCSSDDRNK